MQHVEVAVVGGGPAGLAAALTAVRARRTVAVFDDGAPRNASAPRVHGFFSRDGIRPVALRAAAREELSPYGPSVHDERVSRIMGDVDDGFVLECPGASVHSARVVLATGMRDELPSLPRFRRLWGDSIIACPYCHGWERAGGRWGVVAQDQPRVSNKLELYGNWTDDLVLFADDEHADAHARAAGVPVEARPITALVADGAVLRAVEVADNDRVTVDTLVWPLPQRLPSLVRDLGLELDGDGHLAVDGGQRTSRLGIYAAGDVASFRQQQVVHAASSGVAAARSVVEDLTAARSRTAVPA